MLRLKVIIELVYSLCVQGLVVIDLLVHILKRGLLKYLELLACLLDHLEYELIGLQGGDHVINKVKVNFFKGLEISAVAITALAGGLILLGVQYFEEIGRQVLNAIGDVPVRQVLQVFLDRAIQEVGEVGAAFAIDH